MSSLSKSDPGPALGVDPGLCGACLHRRLLRSRRSTFLRCDLAARDASFPRYPRLPVLDCRGFERESDDVRGGADG